MNRNLEMIAVLVGGFSLLSLVVFAGEAGDKNEKGIIYNPVGKRDPFKAPSPGGLERDVASINPLERFSVEQLTLRSIIKGLGRDRAMFEDPEGKTHILAEGDVIGRERATISRIANTEVIVTQRTFNYLGNESISEKVISLPVGDGDDQSKPEVVTRTRTPGSERDLDSFANPTKVPTVTPLSNPPGGIAAEAK